MEKEAGNIIASAIKRAVGQKKYKEEVYEPKRKTKQSGDVRVDKRTFNKGRPKKTVPVITPTGKDIVPTITPAPPKKLNAIEKLAGQIIGGFIRAKLDAMDMQPAIYSEMIGNRIKDKLDKGQAINFDTLMTSVAKVEKRKGRPKGAKDKVPRKKKE